MIHKPSAALEIQTGEYDKNKKLLKSWPGGKVMIRGAGGVLTPHPGWPRGEHDYVTEFDIVLIGNVLENIFQTHLECRPGKQQWCMRAHRRLDLPGIAYRRDDRGRLRYVECYPDMCDLYQQYLAGRSGGNIRKEYEVLYPKANLIQYKGAEGVSAKCKPLNFFVFSLKGRDGTLAHSELDCCVLQTHSQRTHGMISGTLRKWWLDALRAGTSLHGLPVRLYYDPFESQNGGEMKASWAIQAMPGTTFAENVREMEDNRQMLPPPGEMEVDPTALVRYQDQRESDLAVQMGMSEDALEYQRQLDWLAVEAQIPDPAKVKLIKHHPLVMALCERLDKTYQQQVALDMQHDTVKQAVIALAGEARKVGVKIDDLLREHGFLLDKPTPKPTAAKPPPIVDDATTIELPDPGQMAAAAKGEIVDAEFTEVKE